MTEKERSTIGKDPLDSVVPEQQDTGQEEEPQDEDSQKEEQTKKKRLTTHLPVDLQDRLRDAVYWTPGATLSGLVEEAIREKLDRMEDEREEPFPSREEELKPGRPIE